MNKLIIVLFITIVATSCDPISTDYFTISNYTNDTLKVAGSFTNNDSIQENDSIIKIIPNTKTEITLFSKMGNSMVFDSIFFIIRITMKNDSIYCKKYWQNINTWTKINKSKWRNEYVLTLNNSDF